MKKRIIIMGAAGRDFHNFNTVYRDNPDYEVIAFTAAQIPGIADRRYPAELAGALYPEGIPIHPESELPALIKKAAVDQVIFAYSDVTHEYVMHRASLVLAHGADFVLLGPKATMLPAGKPVISVTAVRTGAGKSQVTRKITRLLQKRGKRVVVIRHPMPYGNLAEQVSQRFATFADLDRYQTTIEEREEYVPHLENCIVVYAGVDYARILQEAEREADIIVWDGGNNDFSFYQSALYIVVADPLRAGQELHYHPGETNLRLADVVIINKVDSAAPEAIELVKKNIKEVNPSARIITAASPVTVNRPELIQGKSVLVVGDGPTLTHGGMAYGAGTIAANHYGARIVDARAYAVGSLKQVYLDFPHLQGELPAMGYSPAQVRELAETINAAPADAVVDASPVRLSHLIKINKPVAAVSYELEETGELNLDQVLAGVV